MKHGAKSGLIGLLRARKGLKRATERVVCFCDTQVQKTVAAYKKTSKHHSVGVRVFAGSFMAVVFFLFLFSQVKALPDTTDNWNFSDTTKYGLSSGLEKNGSSIRLKGYELPSDSDTNALYRFDELAGPTAVDISSNNNSLAGIANSPWTAGRTGGATTISGASFFTAPDTASLSLNANHSIEAYTKFNGAFDANSSGNQYVADKGSYKLYFNKSTGKLTYELATNSTATTYNSGIWTDQIYYTVANQIVYGSDIYYGMSLDTGNGNIRVELWRYNSTTNTTYQVGDTAMTNALSGFNLITLASGGSTLYIGLGWQGGGGTSSKVYSCDLSAGCPSATDRGSLTTGSPGAIKSLLYQNGNLYASTSGAGADGAAVFLSTGTTTWKKLGGTGSTPTSWTSSSYTGATSLVGDGSNTIYTFLYKTTGLQSYSPLIVYKCVVSAQSCTSWTQITSGLSGLGPANPNASISLSYFDSNLYASFSSSGTSTIMRYSGSGTTWTTLTNPWSGSTHSTPMLANDGTNLYTYAYSSSTNSSKLWKCTTPASTCSSWTDTSPTSGSIKNTAIQSVVYAAGAIYSAGTLKQDNSLTTTKYSGGAWQELAKPAARGMTLSGVTASSEWQGELYVGVGQDPELQQASAVTGKHGGAVYKKQGATWIELGGNGLNNSWSYSSGEYTTVTAITPYNNNLYVALQGLAAGDAEVWRWDGTSWSKVGGDGINSGWSSAYSSTSSLYIYDGKLYAGLSGAAGDAEVWRWDGTSWSKVGGDGINSSWSTSTKVASMIATKDGLYAGLGGATTNAGLVYKFNGSTWSQLGGSGASAGNWSSAYEVSSLGVYGGQLYAGVQLVNGNGAYGTIWKYSGSGTSWTNQGGDPAPSSPTSQSSKITSMAVYNGRLYAADAIYPKYSTAGYLWVSNSTGFSKLSTPSFNTSENPLSLSVSEGSLHISTGGNVDDNEWGDILYAAVYSYGKNAVVASTTTSWDTNWHKIAASYDGSTMKLYIDGTLNNSLATTGSVPDNDLPLLIGASYTDINTANESVGMTLDELRLSSIARNSFPDYLYANTQQTITLLAAARKNKVWHWDTWAHDATLNGGSILYRFSTDGGTTWLWWNGSAWTPSSSTAQANDVNSATNAIHSLPVTFDGIAWQAIISGDGSQQVQLNSVTLGSTSDTTAPNSPTSITGKKAASDSAFTLANDGWTNGSSPYFSWDDGQDNSSGILGYCLYLGQDQTADPLTTRGLLGPSPVQTGGNCQFIVASPSVDLGVAGYINTALSTSSSPYYLLVRAIDKAGNISTTSAQFQFRFDNTPPVNPTYITAPSGFVNNKEVTITWPNNGTNAPSDANSGLAGLQYRLNGSNWYGDAHTGLGDFNDLLANDGVYTTKNTPDFANLNEGVNTVYVRTWDHAGNVTTNTVTALIKLNTSGAPSVPLDISAAPSTNTVNSFAFSWSKPTTFIGDPNNITYCYTINSLPSSANCSFTAKGVTSLSAGPYATQPGRNTFYVVARDEASNINYDTYASIDFTANTPAPGLPLNVDVADVSIKPTRNWRLAITWESPQDTGSGVAMYQVLRSTDGTTFTKVGTSSSTSYIDTGLSQMKYYYQVVACDSANNCSANSASASGFPTGKFTSPALLVSEPVISDITTKKATISWATDRASDTRLSIGTTSGVYDPPETLLADQVTNHSISLSNLSAGTTYYIVAKWTDEDGNIGKSQELSFTTSPAPVIREMATSSVGLSNAVVNFTSIGAYRVAIYYGKTDNFGAVKTVNTSASESNYSLNLEGLDDGTKYFYQPIAYDSDGNSYAGNIFSFTTPERPRITNLRFQPIDGEPTSTQKVTWNTNVPTDSTITYGVVGGSGTDITKPQLTTEHAVQMSNLEDNSVYFLIARSRDSNGNLAVSDRQEFRTALDTRPPKISDIQVETSIRGSGSQSRGQVVVSWKTDEPATSQIAYGTGSGTKVLNNKSAEDSALSTEHIVIVSDLSTSEIYTIQPVSQDKARNQSAGSPQTAIIGRGSDDVLTIVLNTLRKLFGV